MAVNTYTRRLSHFICLAFFVALLEDRVLPVVQASETKYFEDGTATKGNTVSNLKDPLPTITLRKESLQRQRRRRLLQRKRRRSSNKQQHREHSSDGNNFIAFSSNNAGAIKVVNENKKSACASSNSNSINDALMTKSMPKTSLSPPAFYIAKGRRNNNLPLAAFQSNTFSIQSAKFLLVLVIHT